MALYIFTRNVSNFLHAIFNIGLPNAIITDPIENSERVNPQYDFFIEVRTRKIEFNNLARVVALNKSSRELFVS